jgi:hypothetical protein
MPGLKNNATAITSVMIIVASWFVTDTPTLQPYIPDIPAIKHKITQMYFAGIPKDLTCIWHILSATASY